VKVSYTGTRNISATGTYINIDAADVAGTLTPLTRFEQTDARIHFSTGWTLGTSTYYSGGSYKYTNTTGAFATLSFTGDSISAIARKSPSFGKLKIILDASAPVYIDLYSSTTLCKQTVYSSGLITPGVHTLKIERAGLKNVNSTGYTVDLDAADVRGVLTVNAIDIHTATIGSIADQTYTGQAITPNPVVTLGSATLTEGTDYTAVYSNNTNVGKATLTITGIGAYTGTESATFNIVKATPTVSAWPTASAIAQGQALSASTLSGGSASTAGTFAFTMPGTVPASAGTYSADVTFTPTNTAYASVSGQVNVTVNAPAPADLSTATIGSIADQAYTGQAITPNPVVTLGSATLTEGTDYTAVYSNNTNVGKATLTITGIGAYTGTESATFNIVKATPTITAQPTASAITQGQALSASTLTGGTGSVAGTFAFNDSTIIPTSAGTYSADVTFTPTDTADYNTVAGKVDVTVNPALVAPTVTGVSGVASLMTSPAAALHYVGGPSVGGNTVTINGSGFTSGSTVAFGDTAATSVTFVSSTELTVSAPAGTAGATVDVKVTTTGGTSVTSSADQYKYVMWAVTGNVKGLYITDSDGDTATKELVGATVKLVIAAGDSLYSGTDPNANVVGTATTDANGNYTLNVASFKGAPLPIGTKCDLTASNTGNKSVTQSMGTFDRPNSVVNFWNYSSTTTYGTDPDGSNWGDRRLPVDDGSIPGLPFSYWAPNYWTTIN
jgi:hypothetical protein